MHFKNLVGWLKSQGCKVTIYKKKKRISSVLAYFVYEPEPHIKMAIKDMPLKEMVSVLLHEYAHFLQWHDGFSKYLDGIVEADSIFYEWIDGNLELTEREIKVCRNTMLSIEYDAELRAIELGTEMGVEGFSSEYHLSDAYSYCTSIKWAWEHRKMWKERVPTKMWPPKRLTHEQLFAPLTAKEKEILKKIKNI